MQSCPSRIDYQGLSLGPSEPTGTAPPSEGGQERQSMPTCSHVPVVHVTLSPVPAIQPRAPLGYTL
jgi:hypothetical protein